MFVFNSNTAEMAHYNKIFVTTKELKSSQKIKQFQSNLRFE